MLQQASKRKRRAYEELATFEKGNEFKIVNSSEITTIMGRDISTVYNC